MTEILEMSDERVTLKREDYDRLVFERDEYKAICHEVAKIKKSIDLKLNGGSL